MIKEINLKLKTISIFASLLFAMLLFFTSVSFASAESGWFSPYFEYVDKNLPLECGSSDVGVEIELIDYNGNQVSSNGSWKAFVNGRTVKSLPSNTNNSGIFCLNPSNDTIQVRVAEGGGYKEFNSPVIRPEDAARTSGSLSDLKENHFKGYVQLTNTSSDPTVVAMGVDAETVPGTSKFLVGSNGLDTAQNRTISANQIAKTAIRIQNTKSFDKTFTFNNVINGGVNGFDIDVDKFSGAGDGTFFWVALQNLNGSVVTDTNEKRLTFQDNPFSGISEKDSFQRDLTPPHVGVYSIAPDRNGNKTAGSYDLLLGGEFIDGTALRFVSIEMTDKNTGAVVGSCEQSFSTEVSKFFWGANNSNHCKISGVPMGDYNVKYFAKDKFGNIKEENRDYVISPEMDIPEMGLGNIEKTVANVNESKSYKPSNVKVTWSTYEFYGHIKDLHNAPIPQMVGSNDSTDNLGFCFSLSKLDLERDKPGVICKSNVGTISVPLSYSMPFNFARNQGYLINFNTSEFRHMLSTTSPTTTIYFRSYGTNIIGTGYSPIEEISVFSSIEYDPSVTAPIVEVYFNGIGADKARVGVDIKDLGSVPKFSDWGVCIAKSMDEALELKNSMEDIIVHNRTFSGYTPATTAERKFHYLQDRRAAGGVAISDHGYLYPKCRLDDFGSNNNSNDELDNWGSGERGGFPIRAAHVFLGFGLTTKSNPQIVDPLLPNTTYYALAFAKNEIGTNFDIKPFTTVGLEYAFNYFYNSPPIVELDKDSYDPDSETYGEANIYFFAADKSTTVSLNGRDVSYKIEVIDSNNNIVPSLSSNGYTKAFLDNQYAYKAYHEAYYSNMLTKVRLTNIPLGDYRIKISLNHDGWYSPLIAGLNKPDYIINPFKVEKPTSLEDTTATGATGSEELNVDPKLLLTAAPNLVRAGTTTKLKWEMDNVSPSMNCSIKGPSNFGTNGEYEFVHTRDKNRPTTDRLTGEEDTGKVNNTQIFTFTCVNSKNSAFSYSTTTRVSIIGNPQEI